MIILTLTDFGKNLKFWEELRIRGYEWELKCASGPYTCNEFWYSKV